MKLAVSGKGGVGKTTVAGLLSHLYADGERRVIAVDADPDANLAAALGLPPAEAEKITPIAELGDLIEERTGARPGSTGGLLKLNPRVDDLPERFSARVDGITLLVMGTVKKGGGGCICPESVLLRSLVSYLILNQDDVVIMDMEAGVEHLGRATAEGVDAFLVVVEPGRRSFQTAETVRRLAADLGIHTVYLVGSKTRSDEERAFIRENSSGFELLGFINYHTSIQEADLRGVGVFEASPEAVAEAQAIKERLDSLLK